MTPVPKPLPRRKVPRPPKRGEYLGVKRARAKADGTLTSEEWARVCAWSRYRCSYCQKPSAIHALQQEHMTPIARGGAHVAGNIALACPACNERKGTQTWEPHPSLPPHPYRSKA